MTPNIRDDTRTTQDTNLFEASKRLFVQFAVKGVHGCACSASEHAPIHNFINIQFCVNGELKQGGELGAIHDNRLSAQAL